MKNWLAIIAAAILIVVVAKPSLYVQAAAGQSAAAQETVPRLVQFNGVLKDGGARPVSGVASVTFAVYAEEEGGAALWTETQNVLADASGHFNVLLGAATTGGFPAELIGTGASRWLGVTLARQTEMPRASLAQNFLEMFSVLALIGVRATHPLPSASTILGDVPLKVSMLRRAS